jgi:transaldolase
MQYDGLVKEFKDFQIKIMADGADLAQMIALNNLEHIRGFTTNPTLMKRSGVKDYEGFAREVCKEIKNKPISFEVFSDDFIEMRDQANLIRSWGTNIYVKIPVRNTKGQSSIPLIKELDSMGIKLNITAIVNPIDAYEVAECLTEKSDHYISIFAGRIADTGIDPKPIMADYVEFLRNREGLKLIWASPRELLNLVQAEEIDCHAITMTPELLSKINLLGKDLSEFTLETVQLFRNDAVLAGFYIS